jgi:hypothetical protein
MPGDIETTVAKSDILNQRRRAKSKISEAITIAMITEHLLSHQSIESRSESLNCVPLPTIETSELLQRKAMLVFGPKHQKHEKTPANETILVGWDALEHSNSASSADSINC